MSNCYRRPALDGRPTMFPNWLGNFRSNRLLYVGARLVLLSLLLLATSRAVAATLQSLGDLPGGSFDSRANAVSADGSVVVGFGDNAAGYQDAFRWTAAAGMVGL